MSKLAGLRSIFKRSKKKGAQGFELSQQNSCSTGFGLGSNDDVPLDLSEDSSSNDDVNYSSLDQKPDAATANSNNSRYMLLRQDSC